MALLALLFVVVPILRHRPSDSVGYDDLNAEVGRAQLAELDADLAAGRLEQDQYDAARADLERELLYDLSGDNQPARPVRSGAWAALFIAIAVPLGATLLYKAIGTERIIPLLAQQQPVQPAQPTAPGHAEGQLSLQEMVARLAQRMESEPDNLEGWETLARSYMVMNRYDLAVPAYRNIMRLGGGDNAGFLADFSDALVATSDGQFTDEVGTLLARALVLEPDNLKALWLAGHWKNQSGDAVAAVSYWERAAGQMQPDSRDRQLIDGQIAKARQLAGMPPASEAVAVADKPAATDSNRDRTGARNRAALVTAFLEGTEMMTERLRREPLARRTWKNLGTLIRRMHGECIRHADLTSDNILVDSSDRFYLVDFDKARLMPRLDDWQWQPLYRFQRALDKRHRQQPLHYTENDWQAFMDGYESGD